MYSLWCLFIYVKKKKEHFKKTTLQKKLKSLRYPLDVFKWNSLQWHKSRKMEVERRYLYSFKQIAYKYACTQLTTSNHMALSQLSYRAASIYAAIRSLWVVLVTLFCHVRRYNVVISGVHSPQHGQKDKKDNE